MSLQPATFEEALRRAKSRPVKPRKPIARVSARKTLSGDSKRKQGASKKKSKRQKLPSRKKLVAELDRLTSLIVRARDGCCVVTGSTEQLTCGHIFSRRSMATRFDISEDGNCHAQSWPSNFRHTFDTFPYLSWYRIKFGQEKLDALYQRWLKGHKYSTLELRRMVEEYRAHPLVK